VSHPLEGHDKLPPTTPQALWISAAALSAIWWMSIRMLWSDWDIDPQYSYGFLVPILCVALFMQRWRDRPPPVPPRSLKTNAWLALPPLLFLAVIQPFFEANPEWRVPGMLGAVSAVWLTLLLVHTLGGRPWLGHFLFPIAFFLIAVPWPRNAEEDIMSLLMEKNAIATLEVLHWCGYEAVRRGHLIALPTGMVGVEEACSGVRSLQSGIMAALFLGEMFRFTSFVRTGLVLTAVVVAVLGNFLRATSLSIIASHEGVAAVEKWHDTAGYAILALTLGSIWSLSWLYQKFRRPRQCPLPVPPSSLPLSIPAPLRTACVVVIAIGTTSLAGTEVWYRSHEKSPAGVSTWTLASGTPGTKPVAIPDRTRRILFFPEGFSERFLDPAGHNWQLFYFRWPAGRTAIQALSIHDPRTCLASIGMTLESQLPSISIEAGGIHLPFQVFRFADRGRPVLVFHSIIAEGLSASDAIQAGQNPTMANYTITGRWDMVRRGIRNRGQRLIEAAVWDTADVTSAAASLQDFLDKSLSISGRP